MSAVLRWMLAACSALLFAVLGLLGEEAQNLAHLPLAGCRAAGAALPSPTRLASDLYGLNTGNFWLSMTPFMIAAAAIAACARRATPGAVVLARFAIVWLLALAYAGLYAWAMMRPWHLGCASLEDHPMGSAVLVVDAALVAIAIVLFRRSRRADSKDAP